MNFALLSLAAAIPTIFSGYLARLIAAYFVSEEIALVAGFSFVLGGGSLVKLNLGADANIQLGQTAVAVGTLVGVVVIWFLFFKREKAIG